LKEYVIYAGVNGAGKSTLYNTNDKKAVYRVNSDEIITKDGGDWKNEQNTVSAMRQSVILIKKYMSEGVSFCQETTLTGKMIFKNIIEAKRLNYTITMHYVGLENADLAVMRVAERVKMGGHGIPAHDIRRRYNISLKNLAESVDLCDNILVYDNTDYFRLIANFRKGHLIKGNYIGVEWFEKLFTPTSPHLS
jgi:predicted ABC-type ATPase